MEITEDQIAEILAKQAKEDEAHDLMRSLAVEFGKFFPDPFALVDKFDSLYLKDEPEEKKEEKPYLVLFADPSGVIMEEHEATEEELPNFFQRYKGRGLSLLIKRKQDLEAEFRYAVREVYEGMLDKLSGYHLGVIKSKTIDEFTKVLVKVIKNG